MQAEAMGKLIAARFPAGSRQHALSSNDLRGLSDRAQKEAAKVLEFALVMVTSALLPCTLHQIAFKA